jgi:hypothetical protein
MMYQLKMIILFSSHILPSIKDVIDLSPPAAHIHQITYCVGAMSRPGQTADEQSCIVKYDHDLVRHPLSYARISLDAWMSDNIGMRDITADVLQVLSAEPQQKAPKRVTWHSCVLVSPDLNDSTLKGKSQDDMEARTKNRRRIFAYIILLLYFLTPGNIVLSLSHGMRGCAQALPAATFRDSHDT